MALTSELSTSRMMLRAPRLTDARAIARHLNNFEVSKRLAVVPFPYSEKDAVEWIEAKQHPNVHTWLLDYQKEVIGAVVLRHPAPETWTLGYWLAQPYWGQGLMSEAVRPVLRHAFEELGAAAVKAGAYVDNSGSIHLLTKLGFSWCGKGTQRCRARGGRQIEENHYILPRETFFRLG
ncbi:GNAT family N-acetyltransferase [Pseudovibrio exalbescens]|uniref:N-acetyltransferase domain-containing protein n=1 Tax=Pseudovibrio exalbescens TaxID=197461 RepID=A0A1U7JHZ3_9HYPH|nr:GNAT family N-acetyltransferase [Pseudovibrio exalbescens]OKL44337.1 hypothetical protein A3843_08010 [Pseudovibrio exalbescens]